MRNCSGYLLKRKNIINASKESLLSIHKEIIICELFNSYHSLSFFFFFATRWLCLGVQHLELSDGFFLHPYWCLNGFLFGCVSTMRESRWASWVPRLFPHTEEDLRLTAVFLLSSTTVWFLLERDLAGVGIKPEWSGVGGLCAQWKSPAPSFRSSTWKLNLEIFLSRFQRIYY